MASESAGIAFPLTYDAAQARPNYSASDFRLTAGAALAVPDGSAFGGVQGVRLGSPSPLVTIDGTTVTVAAHMGWLCPWPGGNGAYEYALPKPAQVAVDSTTGSYKIAVVLEDKAAGHGTGEQVDVKEYPGYTPDSQIAGLVVARVDNGVASDVAPVISQDATVRVATLEQLQSLKAADGVGAVLADGSRYERSGGRWSLLDSGWVQVTPGGGWSFPTSDDQPLAARKVGRLVELRGVIMYPGGWQATWGCCTVPAGMAPSSRVWMRGYRRNTGTFYLDPDGVVRALEAVGGTGDAFLHATWLAA